MAGAARPRPATVRGRFRGCIGHIRQPSLYGAQRAHRKRMICSHIAGDGNNSRVGRSPFGFPEQSRLHGTAQRRRGFACYSSRRRSVVPTMRRRRKRATIGAWTSSRFAWTQFDVPTGRSGSTSSAVSPAPRSSASRRQWRPDLSSGAWAVSHSRPPLHDRGRAEHRRPDHVSVASAALWRGEGDAHRRG